MKFFNNGIRKNKEAENIRLPRTFESTAFDVVIALEALAVWLLAAWLFVRFDTVPTHFNMAGEADAWGSHGMLIFMALIATFTLGLLVYSAYRPKYVSTTMKNLTYDEYLIQARMVRIIGVIIGLLFILIIVKMGGAIFGLSDPAFGMLMLLTMLVLIGVSIGFTAYMYIRRRR